MKRKIILLLGILGLAITGFLTYSHFSDGGVCSAEGCTVVLYSQYSELFSIPVALLGFITYAGILFFYFSKEEQWVTRLLVLGVLAIGYFNWSMFKLGAFCPWCETSHGIMALLYFTYNGLKLKSILIFLGAVIIGAIGGQIVTMILA